MSRTDATIALLKDLVDRGTMQPGYDVAIVGSQFASDAALIAGLQEIQVKSIAVIDEPIADPEKLEQLNLRLIHQDPGVPLKKEYADRQFDLILDCGMAQHIFDVTELWRTLHRLCRKDGMIVTCQPMFGGTGYFNFIPEFFEDIAALNNYLILFSSFVIGGRCVPLYSRLDQAVSVTAPLDLLFAFCRAEEDPFRLPYQNISVREAYGISGFTPNFRSDLLARGYRPLITGNISRDLDLKDALQILMGIFWRRLRRWLKR